MHSVSQICSSKATLESERIQNRPPTKLTIGLGNRLSGAQQLMGVHKVSAFYPFIFQKSGKSTIIRNLAVPRHFVAYLVFISSISVDLEPRNRGPTSLLDLKIRTPVANTGKLRSIGQVPVGVAPKKKVVRPIFFSEGVISRIFFRYMHKDQFFCIFSQIKNNAYLPMHLVHAPRFWWSPSYSFTFSFLCVFFQFLMSCNC